jgi:hypothetical protein
LPPPLALPPRQRPQVFVDFPGTITEDSRRSHCTKVFEELQLPLTQDATAALRVEVTLDGGYHVKLLSARRGVVFDAPVEARNAVDLCRNVVPRIEDALGAE